MAWFLSYILSVGLSLLVGYGLLVKAMGQSAARRQMSHALPWIVLGFAIAFTSAFTAVWKQSVWSFIHLAYIISVSLWLLIWPVRKRKAGSLQLNVGRTWHNRMLFWIGIAEFAIAAMITWIAWLTLTEVANSSIEVAQLSLKVAFWWVLAAFIFALGLNKLELRDNGLCFLYNFIPWQRMKSYTWDTNYPNILVIQIHPRFVFLPASMNIRVPEQHRDAIDRVVQTYIPCSPPDSLALS
ncbi:hypothetical protein IQ260_15250 [Leptolyngbya cf. ectocarpi LEGE 11479]|uniref:DUF5673 domain-containing protein n=1 Tax=Leptolyngbya cf. ectocarpi LEGE 11479 TaxID=1828722 RepID=A0A928ZV43_LEPEC|nr:DUF5673 domain-containing protein [Leptolyngbya ectocarpi]MBE9068006.1 hypothetical protein [Leptolyngbya cf. ectocarpi LEGE 11479]